MALFNTIKSEKSFFKQWYFFKSLKKAKIYPAFKVKS